MKIKLIENGILPKKAHKSDACFDVYCRKIEEVSEGKVICYLGFSSALPDRSCAFLMPRSSLTHKGWIMTNSPGIIDQSYRGEWQMRFEAIPDDIFGDIRLVTEYEYGREYQTIESSLNLSYPKFPYNVGDRCGQFMLHQVFDVPLEQVEELEETERKGGFGSSGK